MELSGADTCSEAPIIRDGVFIGTTEGAADDYAGRSGCLRSDAPIGPEVAYELQLPGRTQAEITVIPLDPGFDPTLSAIQKLERDPEFVCLGRASGWGGTCIGESVTAPVGAPESVSIPNEWNDEIGAFILIDSLLADATGRYELRVAFTPLTDGSPGDRCSNAKVLSLPARETVSLEGYHKDHHPHPDGPGCGGVYHSDLDRVYRVTVPPGRRVVGTLDATDDSYASRDLWFASTDSCDLLLTCIGSNALREQGNKGHQWTNRSDQAADVFVIVGGKGDHEYILQLTEEPTLPGLGCDNPDALSVPFNQSVSLVGYGDNLNESHCSHRADSGSHRIFSVDVPPNHVATVITEADFTENRLSLSLLAPTDAPGCDWPVATCLSAGVAEDRVGSRARVDYHNQSSQTQTLPLVLFAQQDSPPPAIALEATVTPATNFAPGKTCTQPIDLAIPSTTQHAQATGLDLFSFYEGNGHPCLVGGPAPESIFRTTVPPQTELSVDVQSQGFGAEEPIFFILEGDASACDAPQPKCEGEGFRDLAARYANATNAPQSVLIVVDWVRLSASNRLVAIDGAPFTIDLSAQPLAP